MRSSSKGSCSTDTMAINAPSTCFVKTAARLRDETDNLASTEG